MGTFLCDLVVFIPLNTKEKEILTNELLTKSKAPSQYHLF